MIDKETQRIAWACLPRELKEEVKKRYNDVLFTDYDSGYKDALTDFFGLHNLTSDAEGEEMLTVSRKKVQESYAKCKEATKNPYSYPDYSHESALSRMALLDILFGSKCLPDEKVSISTPLSEPKPQPKFHKGDRVKVITDCWKDNVYTVLDVKEIYPQFSYKLSCSPDAWFSESTLELYTEEPKPAEPKFHIGQRVLHIPTRLVDVIESISQSAPYIYHFKHMVDPINGQGIFESDLEPYTEPTENLKPSNSGELESQEANNQSRNLSQSMSNCDKSFDKILKDSFHNHNRLHIAAMCLQGMLSAGDYSGCPDSAWSELAKTALACADALLVLVEVEKGGE